MMRAKPLTLELEKLGPFDPDTMTLAGARAIAKQYYVTANGYASTPDLLTAPDSQPKLRKSKLRPAYGLSLAPADMSGWDVCLWRTPACTAACVLATGGRSRFAPIRRARVLKTRFLAEYPQAFITLLWHEIRRAVKRARARGFDGIDLRLNVASDLRWEIFAPALLTVDGVRPYDYTKAPASARPNVTSYPLTFSVSERSRSTTEALEWLERGGNVAVVFERLTRAEWDGILPNTWEGFPVIDGDLSDARADDLPSTVVGLRAKGAAIGAVGHDSSFVKPGRTHAKV